MNITFHKYHGTGNDFILIDDRKMSFPANDRQLIARMCDRHFGIGADGLILLQLHETADFRMVYFNADGNESTMCGNGGRCIVAFAKQLGIIDNETDFMAVDGLHHARVIGADIELAMNDVEHIVPGEGFLTLDTGSPHYVKFTESLPADDGFIREARNIRYSGPFKKEGINVNVATGGNGTIQMRTYERGVENETLSCGTGVTAVAIAAHKAGIGKATDWNIEVKGGRLNVKFDVEDGAYRNVRLTGPASFVFKGEYPL